MQSSVCYSCSHRRDSKGICKEHNPSSQESCNLHGNISGKNSEKDVSEEEDEIVPLSGHPFFSHIVAKSQVQNPYQLAVPMSFQSYLPSTSVPVILSCQKREWEITYFGSRPIKCFGGGWRQFALENNLRIGDACVFELVDEKNLRFKVRILNGQIPDVLGCTSRSSEIPIMID